MTELDEIRTQASYAIARAKELIPARDERGINTSEIILIVVVVVGLVAVLGGILMSYVQSQQGKLR